MFMSLLRSQPTNYETTQGIPFHMQAPEAVLKLWGNISSEFPLSMRALNGRMLAANY